MPWIFWGISFWYLKAKLLDHKTLLSCKTYFETKNWLLCYLHYVVTNLPSDNDSFRSRSNADWTRDSRKCGGGEEKTLGHIILSICQWSIHELGDLNRSQSSHCQAQGFLLWKGKRFSLAKLCCTMTSHPPETWTELNLNTARDRK